MGIPLTLRLAESLGPAALRLLISSLQRVHLETPRARDEKVIYAFWHGRMLVPAVMYRFRKAGILISEHRDGEYIARVVARLGFLPIRGSTTRGGVRALRGAIERSRKGIDVAFTPDGPRGPRYVVQKGVIYAASRTGLRIVPVGIEAWPAWVVGSWDEFVIPKPFGRAAIVEGEPIRIAPNLDSPGFARACSELETALHRATVEARLLIRPDAAPDETIDSSLR